MTETEKTKPQTDSDAGLKPSAVIIPKAQVLLGDKSRSELYEEIGLGNLEAVKDGKKTLITVESIERYMRNLPPAVIKPPQPRAHNKPQRLHSGRKGAA